MGALIPRASGQPTDLTFRDFKADRALGRSSLYGQMAEVAAEKICGLYGKSPSTLVRIIPAGSGLIDNSRGIFDDLCETPQLPPPPISQFSGGQCDGDGYFLDFAYINQQGFNEPDCGNTNTTPVSQRAIVYGPVSNIHLEVGAILPGTCQTFAYKEVWATCRGTAATGLMPLGSYQVGGSGLANILSIAGINLRRGGGGGDSCGNPAPSYPPPSATPNDLSSTTIINIAPNVPVTVPVTIVPTFAPVVGIFRPEFNVNVGGINVNISAGGFTFSPTLELPVNDPSPYSDPRSTKPSPLPISPPSSGGTCPDVDLTPVIDKLNELESLLPDDCCTTPAKPDDPKFFNAEIVTLSLESGSVALPDGVYKVRLLLIDRSTKEKIEYGGTQADVVYAGWAWFASQFSLENRLPIDSPDKQFIPPNKNQNSFVWTCRAGYKAQVTVYYKEKR